MRTSTSFCILFATKFLRMFSYGALAPVLYAYLLAVGISVARIGALMTGILLGDLLVTLNLTTRADALSRRAVLVTGALLKFAAGLAFATTSSFTLLLLAGVFGVVSISGGEIGPFIAVEQAALTDCAIRAVGAAAANERVPVMFGYYNALGYLAQALGALFAGNFAHYLAASCAFTKLAAMRAVVVIYAGTGVLLALLYMCLSKDVESSHAGDAMPRRALVLSPRLLLPNLNVGLRRRESVFIVGRLSCLFALDAFAGGFTLQTWIALWFSETWAVGAGALGDLLSAANVVAGVSGVSAAYFVKRFGAINTMVWTHLPSNVLLLVVPLMPTRALAAATLVARFCISQMDVPARQAYVAMAVASDERSAAGGVTNLVRSVGLLPAPAIAGYLSSGAPGGVLFNSPWFISGGLKIVYDITLWAMYHVSSGLKEAEAAGQEASDNEQREAREPLLPDTNHNS